MNSFARFVLAVGCLVVVLAGLVAVFYGVEDWRGGRAWAAAQREVRAHGGTTDYAEIIPPAIPDDQNLAMAPLFVKALGYHVDPATRVLTFGGSSKDVRLDGLPYGTGPSGLARPNSGGG